MKNVREICLGVAVAGVVAGAGSAIGCAVATADAGDGTAASDTSASGAENSSAGPKARGGKRTAATNSTVASAKAPQSDTSDRAGNRVARAGAAQSAAGGVSAAERVAAPAALTPLSVPLPAPAPFVPVAPASAVTVNASATTSRNRTASQITEPTHVILIGTDGTNMSKILEYDYDRPGSGFRIVMDQGVTGTTTFVGHTTLSGPSWSTILTGAFDDKTGVFNNIFNPAPYISWPTAINLIEYNEPGVDTAVIANWQYISDIAAAGGYPADVNDLVGFDTSWEVTDDLVVDRTIDLINATSASDSAFIFSYQVAVDEAGHEAGGDSPQYREALINTSNNIARIMAAIDAWEAANPGQQWTVITTTDHGHQPQAGFGHGFNSPNETSSFVIFDLEGDDTDDGLQNLGYSNADITPTIVDLFGIAQRSDFDGAPLQDKGDGIVAPTDPRVSIADALGLYGFPDPITDFVLSLRTVVGAVPYFLNGFVEDITGALQAVVDQDIFLVSTLAGVAEFVVGAVGGALVNVTQAIAGVVARLTGSGVIPPTDPPLPPNPGASLLPAAGIPASVLV
ncbi:MAG: alkaline phosphatase family protein [Mycobacterium sp.]|nr:alkaline phosphatase family protein [Mycobacterium sp.]